MLPSRREVTRCGSCCASGEGESDERVKQRRRRNEVVRAVVVQARSLVKARVSQCEWREEDCGQGDLQ